MRTVFFGTSAFAVPSLEAIARHHDVLLVATQPDRPAGRGLALQQTPVMERALALGLRIEAPDRLDAAFIAALSAFRPQLLTCASYGKILPQALLSISGMAALNVHPSLLPEYRGATPIVAALRDGRRETGVTVFWMSREMDAGDVALQRRVDINPEDTYGSLHDRLAAVGADLLIEAAALLGKGALPRVPQDAARATFTKPLRKSDLQIPADLRAEEVVNFVRSLSPAPAAWTIAGGKRVKVLEARAVDRNDAAARDSDPALLKATDGFVRLERVVPEGRRAMSGAEFTRWLHPRG